ncbi:MULTISPECIES: redox-sensitive transcriptional activator SoxR [unclassified Kitasatospora]
MGAHDRPPRRPPRPRTSPQRSAHHRPTRRLQRPRRLRAALREPRPDPRHRTTGGQRRYTRGTLRRIAFVRAAQRVGLSLDEAKVALDRLPDRPAPSRTEWDRVAESWQDRIDEQIAELQRLKAKLTGCIGCLSLSRCALYNAADRAGAADPEARYPLTRDPDTGPEPVPSDVETCGTRREER